MKKVNDFDYVLDERLRKRKAPLFLAAIQNIKAAEVCPQKPNETAEDFANRCKYEVSKIKKELMAGGHMEKIAEELRVVNEEISNSKKELESLFNELCSVSHQVRPKIKEQIDDIRHIRTTTVSEVNMALSALKDIRKFFLDSDYEKEIKRLSEFISLCNQLKTLKADGTLDALCDTAVRLAIREEQS